MLAIGRGLASAPRLLMLDEPSMGLAPAVTDTIFERISQVHREDGLTILLVEQRVAEALELSDHGYVLETGRIVLDGPYQTLLADDRVRRSYLGIGGRLKQNASRENDDHDKQSIGRRTTLALGAAAGAAGLAGRARAQAPKEVEIAMLVPLSGPWARQGILEKMGAELAIDDVNNAGGIKSLGGAKLKLLEYDTQDTAEKAKDAAQRMLAQNPDLVGGFGCWLSTFTLAVTEVTERAKLPWLTLSYSDLITGRGYKYVFQSSPTADQQPRTWCPSSWRWPRRRPASGRPRLGLIGDNTAASVSFMKPIRAHVLTDEKLTAVVDQTYTPPLTDATTLGAAGPQRAPRFRAADLDERAGRQAAGGQIHRIQHAADQDAADRQWRALGGAGTAEGRRCRRDWRACWWAWPTGPARTRPTSRHASSSATGEPWFGHDSIFAYAHVMILKEALERAGVADREKVNDALHALDMTDRAGAAVPWGSPAIRRAGAAHRGQDGDGAVAEWPAGYGLSAGSRRRRSQVEILSGRLL